jgi:hypothetical protein
MRRCGTLCRPRHRSHGPGACGDERSAFAVALAFDAGTAGKQLDLGAPDPVRITAGIARPEQPLLPLAGFLSAGCPMGFRDRLRRVVPARFAVVCHVHQAIPPRVRSKVFGPSGTRAHGSRHVGGKSWGGTTTSAARIRHEATTTDRMALHHTPHPAQVRYFTGSSTLLGSPWAAPGPPDSSTTAPSGTAWRP